MENLHPCIGKDCSMCETCIYDEPLENLYSKKTEDLSPGNSCNYCGYLIKQYNGANDTIFNACCSKSVIETENARRPRTIDFRLTDVMLIKKPFWCPKLKEETRGTESFNASNKERLTYNEKKDKLKSLPPQLNWNQLTVGKKYVVPSILGRKRKLLTLIAKTDFTLVFKDIKPNGQISDEITNIFKSDIETNFIVEYKNF